MTFCTPEPLLVKRLDESDPPPSFVALCAGFELKVWRYERLAAHLTDWIPEFTFRPEDLPQALDSITSLRQLMERATHHLYAEGTTASRGEIGELLLHLACRQFCETFPSICKLYYKTSSNDVVKGFDIAHTKYDSESGELELWLGEAKFFENGKDAVRRAIESITNHLERDFLIAEKAMIGGKISPRTPGYSHIEWLFNQDTSLQEIVDRLIIPVLVTYDSAAAKEFQSDTTYNDALRQEISALHSRFDDERLRSVELRCFYLPMHTKKLLEAAFNRKLQAYRQ